MAGSASTITYDNGKMDGAHGAVRKILIDWTSDDTTGAVTATTKKISGTLIKAVTDPSATAPTADYDIVISDDEGVNVLAACDDDLLDRHTSTTEEVYFLIKDHAGTPLAQSLRPVVCSTLSVAVTNAGNSKQGQIIIYWTPGV